MPSYFPPKKNTEFIFYVGLVDQASRPTFKANPTIASGDFKVSTDGGALGNLGTLPTVTPASGKMVKITLSTSEMNGDNVTVVCSDAAGAEWDDLIINIQTAARQLDDLAYPTTSGRSIDVTATGAVGIDWGNVENPTTAVDLSGTDIQLCDTVTTNTDMLTAASVNTQVVDALATDTYAELSAVPAATSTLADKINWLFALARNKLTQTSTTLTLRNDADGADIASSTVSDDGTTATRGEFS